MPRRDLDTITHIAAALRQQLGRCELECPAYAGHLRDALRRHGYPAEHVYGYVLVDGNWRDQWGVGPVDWYDEDDTVERNMDHHWVTVGNLVVDIGAEQFNPLMRDQHFPAVYIARRRQAQRHVPQEVLP